MSLVSVVIKFQSSSLIPWDHTDGLKVPFSFTLPYQAASNCCHLSLLSFQSVDLIVQRKQCAAAEMALNQTKLSVNAGSGTS